MGKSDREPTKFSPPSIVKLTADEEGYSAVRTAVMTTNEEFLAIIAVQSPEHDLETATSELIERLTRQLIGEPSLAVAIDSQPAVTVRRLSESGLARQARLTQRLVLLLRGAGGEPALPVPTAVLRVSAVRAAGGFDPQFPGLGLVDLAERLERLGFDVGGVSPQFQLHAALPFVDVLNGGLSVADQCRTEGLWLTRHRTEHDERATVTAAAYRRALLTACRVAGRSGAVHQSSIDDRTYREQLDRIASEAASRWQGPAPHEVQVKIGHRADWRFLLPDRDWNRTFAVLADDDRRTNDEAWQWLVDDGWTKTVTVSTPSRPIDGELEPKADVVFVGLGASLTDAVAACGPNAGLVVEQGRSPAERARQIRTLRADGSFPSIEEYLVTPNLEHAKRYVPLADGLGLQWLLAPPPMRGDSGRKASVIRSVRSAAVTVAARAARGAVGPAVAASIGNGLLIAVRGAGPNDAKRGPVVLITSGHDEGSRVVLAPLAPERTSPGPVTKIAPRPRYNRNVDAEVARIHALRKQLTVAGVTVAGVTGSRDMLPDVGQPFDVGPLRASQESYAGRWTASDLCYRIPQTQGDVLEQVVETIDRFTLATITETTTWSSETFHRLLGDLFDRYDQELGADPTRQSLRERLRGRADALSGTPLPLGERHYDLGPWNIVFGEGEKPITLIDWELGPPRTPEASGPAGADQLYFIKYWLHIALDTKSVDDEQTAFDFLAPTARAGQSGRNDVGRDRAAAGDPRAVAAAVMGRSLDRLGVSPASMPLLVSHVWIESALHTIERRRANGIEPGSHGRYLETIARTVDQMMAFWPLED